MKSGFTFIILFALFIASSCRHLTDEQKIVGNWKLYKASFKAPEMDPKFIEKATKTLESSVYGFSADKNFQINDMSFSGGSYKGIWGYTGQNKKLTLYYPDLRIDPEEYDVLELTRNSLIIRQTLKSGAILEYRLKKIKD
jgi:hypothetical protein